MDSNLELLAEQLGTDKLQHGYLPYYQKHLPKKAENLLEIGAYKGASLLLWDKFYEGKTTIHAMDLFQAEENVTDLWCYENGFIPYIGDQSNYTDLDKLPLNLFDVIIEDGSHNSHHQIISFTHCFLNNLKSGGLWVTEDLHCCNEPYYWGGGITLFDETLLYFFQNWKDESFLNRIEGASLLGSVKAIMHLFGSVDLYDGKICFITKK